MRAMFVFEKFTEEDTDPIHDLGIGIYYPKTFESTEELYKYLYDIMPALFKVNHPLDLVSKYKLLYFKGNVVKDLKQYIEKYVIMPKKLSYWSFDLPEFHYYVINRARKEGKSIPVFERFREDSDPIHDMSIGLKQRFKEIKHLLEYLNAHSEMTFEQIDVDEDEFTIRTDTNDVLETGDYRSRGRSWEEVGVYNGFSLDYYLDVILLENKIIRSIQLSNNDIEDFDFWDTKVLCDNVLEISDDDLSEMIIDDYLGLDVSNALDVGLDEAWDIAEANNDKTQKRISN